MRLALFQPDIPQNVGAAIRLCACLGVGLDIIEPCTFRMDDRSLKRAALDYGPLGEVERHGSWAEFLVSAQARRTRLLLLTTKSREPFTGFRFAPDDTVLMGSESRGAPDEVHAAVQARLRIPLVANARSLNIATAAALALGEGLRQTNLFPAI